MAATASSYEQLLSPGRIGPVTTRNRILKTGAGMLMWHESDTHMRPEMLAFYERMARGGTGLIIVESPTIDYPAGARWRMRYRIDDDRFIEGLKELVDVIHKHGCPTFMQMNHDGPWQADLRHIEPDQVFAGPPVGASPVSVPYEADFHNEVPRELSIPEIEDLVDKFAAAAERAQKAGFDGVDVNAASSHLLHNFLSPFWNRREDIYGGSSENRTRFPRQVIQEIKRRCGPGFACTMIINGLEVGQVLGFEDSMMLTAELARENARWIEKAGADAIMVRSHWLGYHVPGYLTDLLFYPDPPIPLEKFPKEYYAKEKGAGANTLLAAAIKKEVSIPVTVVGRLDADFGERLLEAGACDFIGMTRRLHADPDYVNKVRAGRMGDIAPCTACDNCLGTRACRINGLLGTEFTDIEPAPTKKKVLVIGGGPGGMEAARVSALRGHDVTLCEKQAKLGGLLPIAAIVKGPHPEDVPLIADYLDSQVRKLGVKVVTGKAADMTTVEQIRPDVVFLATGATATIPPIKGIDRPNVVSGMALHKQLKMITRFVPSYTVRSLTKFYLPLGKNVVVIGGALQGCELAEFLVKRGRNVTIVEQADLLGEGMVDAMLFSLMIWFEKHGVQLVPGVKEYVEITDKGLIIVDRDGVTRTLQADTFVSALPLKSNDDLLAALREKVAEVYPIGDAGKPGLIRDAIAAGLRTARTV
jgi:2,4-dienoyl-CoA reductase (NADPH2)